MESSDLVDIKRHESSRSDPLRKEATDNQGPWFPMLMALLIVGNEDVSIFVGLLPDQ